MRVVDVSNQTFALLKVLQYAGSDVKGRAVWMCLCACGTKRLVSGTDLRTGRITSCGCTEHENRSAARRTHGDSTSLTYVSWIAMLHRCENPQRTKYEAHGGRGISVCKRWHKYENFLADMGPRESTALSIERRDNDKKYMPSNCYWADKKTQARNRRNSSTATYKGKTKTLAAWAEQLGKAHSTLSWRKQQGWSDTEIINGRR